MEKVVVIVGPTGVGKSATAIKLAQCFAGEIISGDSIQVYRGCDIGSAKISEKEKEGISHHLIDILDLDDDYNVKCFQKQAREQITFLSSNKKLPIICGGTGLYISAVLKDYKFNDEKESSYDFSGYNNEQLYELLVKYDPKQAKILHPNNRRRIERALTIYYNLGISKGDLIEKNKPNDLYDYLIIGLTAPREIIYSRIDARVDQMVAAGLINEVKELLARSKEDALWQQGIGYREVISYLNDDISYERAIELIKRNSRRYAKRQYTWFNNQMNVNWFDITDEKYLEKIKEMIREWL